MWHGVLAVYQRIAGSVNKTAARRRSTPLHVVVLEERATPAATESFLLPIQPPETVVILAAPPLSANAGAPTSLVRRDLFGAGDTGKPEHANEWEEFLAQKDEAATHDGPVALTQPPHENEDLVAAETAVVEVAENMPCVD